MAICHKYQAFKLDLLTIKSAENVIVSFCATTIAQLPHYNLPALHNLIGNQSSSSGELIIIISRHIGMHS